MKPVLALALALPALAQTALDRAIGYLSAEVEKWPRENGCYSCHNNGDAARALMTAARLGRKVDPAALSATLRFLSDPTRWDQGKDSPFNDKKLARLQFSVALGEAARGGHVQASVLPQVAREAATLQSKDGAWRIEPDRDPGAPATWGTTLATALTVRLLEQANDLRVEPAIRRGRDWLARAEPRYTVDRAALVLAGVTERHLPALLAAQTSDGGWGLIPKTPAEVFDTSIALLALQEAGASREVIDRGRAFLLATQQPMGGWPETTRPPGSQSYAEHISTSGWATLALLLTGGSHK